MAVEEAFWSREKRLANLIAREAQARKALLDIEEAIRINRCDTAVVCPHTEKRGIDTVCGGGCAAILRELNLPKDGGYWVGQCMACGTFIARGYCGDWEQDVDEKAARKLLWMDAQWT